MRIAYAPRISHPPDDLASQLERLFDERPEHTLDLPFDVSDPEITTDGEPPLSRAEEADVSTEPIESPSPLELAVPEPDEPDELDELRDQLDEAFNEVEHRINRLELRLAALRTTSEAHAAVTERLDVTAAATLERLERLLALVEGAVADLPEDVEPPRPVVPDTTAIDALAAQLVDDRLHLEAAVDQLRQQVVAVRTEPVELDTRRLEEATRQWALHNAADIATLSQDVDALARGLRLQDQRLAEVHATLDWVKQRLLAR